MLRILTMSPYTPNKPNPPGVERRRHTRYRLVERVFISKRDGTSYPATTNEISISGLSASSMALFQPGDEVHLSLIAGHEIVAVVLRKIGTVYGFEFALLPTEVAAEIHNLCRGLVPFRSSAAEA